jgi:hypothetical protein
MVIAFFTGLPIKERRSCARTGKLKRQVKKIGMV